MIHQISTQSRRVVGSLERGDDLLKPLEALCERLGIRAGFVRVTGALAGAQLVRFDQDTRQYPVSFEHDSELVIAQLGGYVASMGGSPLVRLDGVLVAQGPAGAQLVSGQVRQAKVLTCEFIIDVFDDLELGWSPDSDTGRVILGQIARIPSAAPVVVEATPAPTKVAPASPAPSSASPATVSTPAAFAAASGQAAAKAAPQAARPAQATPSAPSAAARAASQAPAAQEQSGASSYYIQIDGKKYDRQLVEAAREATQGAGDGRISKDEAEYLLELVKDGDTYTDIERDTVQYLQSQLKWTPAALEWFNNQLKAWEGRAKAQPASTLTAKDSPPASTMSWGEAISAAQAPARAASPSAAEIYGHIDDDDLPEISPGDHLDHPKLGRCRVMKVEDDEYAHIRLPSGKISKLALDLFDISHAGQEQGRNLFKLRMRPDARRG